MAKLTGFNRVAVIEQSGKEYCFALYDDDMKIGDQVYVSGNQYGVPIYHIKDIISVEEVSERCTKNITAEVICKVDTSAYEERVKRRKEAEKIKKEMDKMITKIQSEDKYTMYAERSPELAEMLEKYKGLTEK